MKALIAAVGLTVLGASAASAQYYPYPGPVPYDPGQHRYEVRHHHICQDKAWRLHDYERRAAADGRISRGEQRIINNLRADLQATCGGHRWRG